MSVEPNAFTLGGHEVRTVTVSFGPDTTSARSNRILLSLHSDADGSLLATFEHPLVITGGTDCSVSMVWKDAIVEAGELRGFAMACSVRSQSEARSTFQVSLSPHPAFAPPELPALTLEPGEMGQVIIPIRWDRAVKDGNGWNHPVMLEVTVPVSNGRRTSRMRWELIETKLDPFTRTDAAPSANGTAAHTQPVVVTQPAASAPEPAPAPQPAAAQPSSATSTVITLPTAPVAPAAAAASAAPAQVEKSPTVAPATSSAPVLVLNKRVELLMLAAPVDAKPTTPSVNGTSANGHVEVTTISQTVVAAAPPAEVVELSLFPGIVTPNSLPVTPAANGKHEPATPLPAAPAAAPQVSTQVVAPQIATPQVSTPQVVAPQVPPSQPTPAHVAAEKSTAQPQVAAQVPTQVSAPAPAALAAPVAASAAAPAPAAPPPLAAAPAPVEPSAAPTAPPIAPSASTPTSANGTQAAAASIATPAPAAPTQTATQVPSASAAAASSAPAAAAAPKLTPYSPAKWDASDNVKTPVAAPPNRAAEPSPAPEAAQTPLPARAVRERQAIDQVRPHRHVPAGLLIGGLAAVALIVAAVFGFKPSVQPQAPSTTPVSVSTPVVADNTVSQPQHSVRKPAAHKVIKPKSVAATPAAQQTATPAPAPTAKAATPRPATPAPATPKPAAQKQIAARPPASRPPGPQHAFRHIKLYQPESGSVVALGAIEAYYGPRGRTVRVLWGSAEQASATIQLIDDHGTIVSSASARGARQSVLLYLPRGYHGSLTVQVSSIGKLGERVAKTTSLPPF